MSVTTITTATQGVLFTEVFEALQNLFVVVTELPTQRVVQWFFKGRPAIEGADLFIWFRLDDGSLAPSTGPGRWGNKTGMGFTVFVETRFAAGKSQVDNSRVAKHYLTYWKMVQALQNNMLFSSYTAAEQIEGELWQPPIPEANLPPLTVEPMLITKFPGGTKDQQEEWTLTTAFSLQVPCVLKLIV